MKEITITNARVNNLKNVSLTIPKNKLIVITGLSGSGKSSLAFDTIYAEGQRRYAESLSAYARQFMDVQDKPDVDEIKGLSPTIAIDQKNIAQNPRSTVGTATEIYDYLRLLFARIGVQYDPKTNTPVKSHTPGDIVEHVRKQVRASGEVLILSPLLKQDHIKKKQLLESIEQSGYDTIRLNGVLMKLGQLKRYTFDAARLYDIDLVIGTATKQKTADISKSVDVALDLSNGFIILFNEHTGQEFHFSTKPYSTETGTSFEPIEPRSFSFNSPHGACPRCTGLGYTLDIDVDLIIPNTRLTIAEGAVQPWTRIVGNQSHFQKLLTAVADAHGFSVNTPVEELSQKVLDILFYGTDGQMYAIDGKNMQFDGVIPYLVQRHAETDSDYIRKEIEQYMREKICPMCDGKRLKKESRFVRIGEYGITDIAEMSVEEAVSLFSKKKTNAASFAASIPLKDQKIAEPIFKEITIRLENLFRVGLGYISLDRAITTLSGGEAQRIRLATQLATGLTDVIYILDEPSIGLHPKDTLALIHTLCELRDIGNTVIVVEHDSSMMNAADLLIDVGPGAGEHGGHIMAMGTPAEIKRNAKSLTGRYLSEKESIAIPAKTRKGNGKNLTVVNASAFNLKHITVDFPLGMFICVSGVSGSGKSSLVVDILSKALTKHFYRAKATPGAHEAIKGIEHIDKVISIDQSPIGRTPRSNPATYTGVFTPIRDLFTDQSEARMRGYDAGMFSFNVKGGGRCEACAGEGYRRIPMQFLSDVFVECSECEGKRYTKDALDVHYRGKNIADVLNMSIEEAYRFFHDIPAIAEKLKILRDVGLGYISLGQPATTLSGGEAQRIKLATELSRRATGQTLYILDEPTTGLHMDDIKRLLLVLNQLVDKGHTVITIEHNIEVLKSSDWVIDLGPKGGKEGGELVAAGPPKKVAEVKKSESGKYLREVFSGK